MSWKLIVVHRDIYYAKKILNSFVCVEVRIVLEKWNIYEAHLFSSPLLQTCRLETNTLCLNTRLRVKKKFQTLIIFIEINVNICLLCVHPVITSIIHHTRRPNCQQKVCYAIGFHVSADFLSSHFEELTSTFFTSFHFAPRVMY